MNHLHINPPNLALIRLTVLITALTLPLKGHSTHDSDEELTVWGQERPVKNTQYVSPNSLLTPEDMLSINAATTEDLVKYEPSLIIRRRFIGDANGTMGVRGSNMFQTPRSMVFADGVPLHYFLQTRWSGAPRWSLVSADEIAKVEVLYGPFSAEYSGNSMGGVINIETAIPDERHFHFEGSLFSQNFSALGFDDELSGQKSFLSYGDRFDKLSLYASYNHLQNDSQPQDFRFTSTGFPTGGEADVNGAIQEKNEYGEPVIFFGDTGPITNTTDNVKLKIGYEMEKWSAIFNIAHEDRESRTTAPNNYLKKNSGDSIWNGRVVQNGTAFNVRNSNFAVSELDRQSLLIGGRLQGELTNNWWLEASMSHFEVTKDETRDSSTNPLDPAFTLAGEVSDYDDTGWDTFEIKFQNDHFFNNENLSIVTGMRHERYSLQINNYGSDNYQAGLKTTLSNSSGGKSMIQALFAQLGWQVNGNWDIAFGGRHESWKSEDGYFGAIQHIDRSENRFSPKFSVGLKINDIWNTRYSLAKAYRFPIVEELFQNERRTLGTSLANVDLEPEDGLHQNLMLERSINDGYIRINIFHEVIDDVIFAQTAVIDNVAINTFIPIDEVKTQGIEFIYNQYNILNSNIDIRFNTAYTNSEIMKNSANTLLEGNTFPRMPEWRANILASYHINDRWDLGGGALYTSDNFGDPDNRDTEDNVFGSHDGYLFLNIKTSYRLNENFKLSAGIDNITDELAYVHHPWPGRTLFLSSSLDF